MGKSRRTRRQKILTGSRQPSISPALKASPVQSDNLTLISQDLTKTLLLSILAIGAIVTAYILQRR